jgi:hypothetical protein
MSLLASEKELRNLFLMTFSSRKAGLYEGKKRVAAQCTGDSTSITTYDNRVAVVTKSPVTLSLLAGKFREGPGDPAAVLATCVYDETDKKSPFIIMFMLSSLNSIPCAYIK